LGNVILSDVVPDYDGELRFKQFRYQLSTTLEVLRRLQLRPPVGFEEIYPNRSADEFFVGYLIFDALVGNTDRHHENWGVVVVPKDPPEFDFYLTPSFDHASSLGRNESDQQRARRLVTSDQRSTVQAYAERARSAFFGPSGTKPMRSREVLENLAETYPESARFWASKIVAIPSDSLAEIFAKIDPSWISRESVEFGLRMLRYNQGMIKEIIFGS
jgi:hypothetical protein